MPRQDVPYGGAICRLKERIAEIWDELGKKLHSINGVEGDAAGDVKIVSGDAAVVITSDQVNHQIEVTLDSSQLPAAAVSSVNGQTGAVALDAGDIPSDGNSDVQTDIDVNKAAISACSSAITSEQLARQNADSTLQTNINAANAQIALKADAANVYTKTETDNKIQQDLGNYAFMVRTVNNQFGIQGVKEFNIRPYAKINVSKLLTTSPSEDTFVKLYEVKTGGILRVIHGYIKSMWFIHYRFEIEFWIGGFNASSTFLLCRSLGQNNDNIRVTRDSSNKWAIWFKYPSGSGTTNRAFTEIIDQFYSYYYGTDLITVIPPDNQVFVPASSAEWSNYTIINATEIM